MLSATSIDESNKEGEALEAVAQGLSVGVSGVVSMRETKAIKNRDSAVYEPWTLGIVID